MVTNVGFKKTKKTEHQYKSGAHRDSRAGKGSFVEMPWNALFLVSRIYEEGNRGRGWRNWEHGMPVPDLLDSSIRHAGRYIAGHRAEPHLSQGVWNMLNALEMAIRVEMGWLSKEEFYKMPNHFGLWKPGDPPPSPLSPQEREWLKVWGLELPGVPKRKRTKK